MTMFPEKLKEMVLLDSLLMALGCWWPLDKQEPHIPFIREFILDAVKTPLLTFSFNAELMGTLMETKDKIAPSIESINQLVMECILELHVTNTVDNSKIFVIIDSLICAFPDIVDKEELITAAKQGLEELTSARRIPIYGITQNQFEQLLSHQIGFNDNEDPEWLLKERPYTVGFFSSVTLFWDDFKNKDRTYLHIRVGLQLRYLLSYILYLDKVKEVRVTVDVFNNAFINQSVGIKHKSTKVSVDLMCARFAECVYALEIGNLAEFIQKELDITFT